MTTSSSSYLDAATDLFDQIADAAKADEPIGDATVVALHDADLFGIMTPREVGGSERPLIESIDIFAEVSRADGSTGWCLMAAAAGTAFFGAWAGDETVEKMFAAGVPVVAGQFAPNGTGRPVRGGYELTGHYSFGSGINHASWVGAGFMTEPDEPDVPAAYLFGVVPKDAAQLEGNWDVLGLGATASWDYSLDAAWLPESATFDFFAPVRRRGGAMYELGVLPLTAAGHAGWAIGVTRRALDELIELAQTKQRMGAAAKLVDSESFRLDLARLESRARAAESWVRECFVRAEESTVATGAADTAAAILARQATVHVTREGADIVRGAYLLAGTTGLREGPLQRCFRDIHAGSQHFFAGDFATRDLASQLLD